MKICPVCKKEFLNKNHPETTYCSNQCRSETRKKTIDRKCLTCGKEFSTIPAHNKKYCSSKCYWKSMEGKPAPTKGRTLTEEHCKKLSESHKGQVSWNKGGHATNSGSFKKGHKQPKGEKSFNWKGGKVRSRRYIFIHKPNHPFCNKRGYVYEHRLVMEKFLKRYLTPTEVIHHINGIRDDNRLENLMLFANNSLHLRYNKFLKRQSKK